MCQLAASSCTIKLLVPMECSSLMHAPQDASRQGSGALRQGSGAVPSRQGSGALQRPPKGGVSPQARPSRQGRGGNGLPPVPSEDPSPSDT